MVALGNPVQGYIHPKGWVPPAGSLDMHVIRDCADHRATGQGCALDINNGRCDGKVLAVGPGVVRDRDDVQGIIRIVHPDGSVSGYAHMKPILVVRGQAVTQGQQIGEIGDAHDPAILNFSGCHLHFGFQLAAGGPEVDPWPLLDQNGGDMLGIVTATLLEGAPRQFSIPAGTTLNGYDPARPGKAIVSQTFPTGSSAPADARVRVEWPDVSPLPIPNGYPFLRCTAGIYAGLLVVESYVKLAPAPAAPPADCTAAVKAATDPLNAKITKAKAALV